MPGQVVALTGRAEVLAATGGHPYGRLHTGDGLVRGFSAGPAAAWFGAGRRGMRLSAHGEPAAVVRLVADLAARGDLAGVVRLDLPRVDHGRLAERVRVIGPEDWDFRWTTVAPAPQPGQDRAVRLDDRDGSAIGALLERAYPTTGSRPGDPRVVAWHGIRDDGRLVACAADRSKGGVGSIGAVAVDPAAQGRGLGAALTTAMAHAMVREYGLVTLGVHVANDRAIRLYRRLGFTDVLPRTSATLTG